MGVREEETGNFEPAAAAVPSKKIAKYRRVSNYSRHQWAVRVAFDFTGLIAKFHRPAAAKSARQLYPIAGGARKISSFNASSLFTQEV